MNRKTNKGASADDDDDASSSLSAGAIADEFATLKQKIDLATSKRGNAAPVSKNGDDDDDDDEEPVSASSIGHG